MYHFVTYRRKFGQAIEGVERKRALFFEGFERFFEDLWVRDEKRTDVSCGGSPWRVPIRARWTGRGPVLAIDYSSRC